MDTFSKEFIMEMFLQNDSAAGMGNVILAATDVMKDNCDNIALFDKMMSQQCDQWRSLRSATNSELQTRSKDKVPSRTMPTMYYEDVIKKYSNEEYEQVFKMKKSTSQILFKNLKEVGQGHIPVSEKRYHIFLSFLMSDITFEELGHLYKMGKTTVSRIFYDFAQLLVDQRYSFISWPSVEEQQITRFKINGTFKYPNCVGFIDACQFRVKPTVKKKHNVVLLQAVCDENLLFTDVFVSEVGKYKKAKVYKSSPLSKELKNLIDFDCHLLGNSEYKNNVNLITPFTTEEVLTREEMKFNEIHRNACNYISRAFQHFKEKFRKLHGLRLIKQDAVSNVITAACIIHNFIIMYEGCPEIKHEVVSCEDGVTIDPTIIKTAEEKRQFLCNYINFMEPEFGNI